MKRIYIKKDGSVTVKTYVTGKEWNAEKHFGLTREQYDSLSDEELRRLKAERHKTLTRDRYKPKAMSPEEGIEYYSCLYGGNWRYSQKHRIFVSDLGKVGSKFRKLIAENPTNHGYRNIDHTTVHRIVWETFIGDIPEGMDLDHLDENRSNCALSNLRCVTHKENTDKRDINGAPMQGRSGSMHGRSKMVVQMDMDGNVISEYESTNLAAIATGIQQSTICKCCNHPDKFKSAGGFRWKYGR